MSDGARGRSGLALTLAVGGGLALAGASLAAWVREVRVDDVAGVPIASETVTLGVALAPLALPLGVAAAALGVGLVLRHPALRRALGAVLVLLGAAALVAVGLGVVDGLALGEGVEAGAVLAVTAGIAVTASGVLAVRRAPPPPTLPPRYDLDADDADAEWRLASVEDEAEIRTEDEGDRP